MNYWLDIEIIGIIGSQLFIARVRGSGWTTDSKNVVDRPLFLRMDDETRQVFKSK